MYISYSHGNLGTQVQYLTARRLGQAISPLAERKQLYMSVFRCRQEMRFTSAFEGYSSVGFIWCKSSILDRHNTEYCPTVKLKMRNDSVFLLLA
jgi:hypothetical protein